MLTHCSNIAHVLLKYCSVVAQILLFDHRHGQADPVSASPFLAVNGCAFPAFICLISFVFFFLLPSNSPRFSGCLITKCVKLVGAIFAVNAVQEVAYQMYRLSDQSILADIISDPKRLAVAQAETSSSE